MQTCIYTYNKIVNFQRSETLFSLSPYIQLWDQCLAHIWNTICICLIYRWMDYLRFWEVVLQYLGGPYVQVRGSQPEIWHWSASWRVQAPDIHIAVNQQSVLQPLSSLSPVLTASYTLPLHKVSSYQMSFDVSRWENATILKTKTG